MLFVALVSVFIFALWLGGEIRVRQKYAELMTRLPQTDEEQEADSDTRWEIENALDDLETEE